MGIFFDMRGYPHGTAWKIVPHLTEKEHIYAANFRRFIPMGIQLGEASPNIEHLTMFEQPIPPPKKPLYLGVTIMLIDERT